MKKRERRASERGSELKRRDQTEEKKGSWMYELTVGETDLFGRVEYGQESGCGVDLISTKAEMREKHVVCKGLLRTGHCRTLQSSVFSFQRYATTPLTSGVHRDDYISVTKGEVSLMSFKLQVGQLKDFYHGFICSPPTLSSVCLHNVKWRMVTTHDLYHEIPHRVYTKSLL